MSRAYVYGIHAVKSLLTNRHRATKKLYVSLERDDLRIQQLLKLASEQQIAVEALSSQQMKQHFSAFTHQGVVAHVDSLPHYDEKDVLSLLESAKSPSLLLILDGVTDPHNLGACLRTANAAGVDFVMIPKDKNASLTPTVSKVACGAAESIPLVRVTNLARSMEVLKQAGVWIYGAAPEESRSLYTVNCKETMAFVLGAEGKGMRQLTRKHCDGLFSLPMLGEVDSLNVSVAAGICLYEAIRQRMP